MTDQDQADPKPLSQEALDAIAVAPPDPAAEGGPQTQAAGEGDDEDRAPATHPRQGAGQDKSIAERLERDPECIEAQLDNGLDETMDASDPPSLTQPGSGAPAPSSGYDADGEARRQEERGRDS